MKIRWKPQPKQEKALASNAFEVLFGGARGGGKTAAGQAWLLYDIDKPLLRALVIRRNFTDLSDWIDRAKQFFKPNGAKFVGDTFYFPSGAQVKTGHLDGADAYTKYQGHEYHRILIEELSHIPKLSYFQKLVTSCRSTQPDIKPQVFCTTNPDEPGLEWIKDYWGIPDNPDFNKVYTKVVGGIKREFIPSKIEDNQELLNVDPEYLQRLEIIKETDPELYEAWRNGNWGGQGVEGAYYKTQINDLELSGRIRENIYDPLLPVHTWCDLGIADSFTIGYFQNAGHEWRVIDYDEFEGESLGEAIRRMRDKPYVYGEHYAPHDIEVRELGTGKSRKEIAESLGIRYNTCPRMTISDGINALRMRFKTLYFDTKTEVLLKRLKRYHKEYDDKRGVYKDRPVHDINSHGADMMRYWAITDHYTPDAHQEMIFERNRQRPTSMR
jgi:hypothetical protein